MVAVDQNLAGRRVLITGGTGFVGAHLAATLAGAGAEVHVLRRGGASLPRLPVGPVVWHEADLLDADRLDLAIATARPDVVFHLAAYGTGAHGADRDRTLRVNVMGTWNLWQALRDRTVRIVYTGACGEYGLTDTCVSESHPCDPAAFYPATKNAAGTLLAALGRETGREVVIVRPFNPYGPGDRPDRLIPHVVKKLLAGDDVSVTAGEQRRDFLFVSDLIDALVRAAVRPIPSTGGVYNIGSGRETTLREVITLIAGLVGEGALERVRFGALPYPPDEVWHLCADISRARRDLGFEPRVGLEEGLSITVAWYLAGLISSELQA